MDRLSTWDNRPNTPNLGRPVRVVRLPFAAIRQYRPGQRVDALVQPLNTWFAPAMHAGQVVGTVWAASDGTVQSFQFITPGTVVVHPSYTDPSADVSLINLEPMVYVLLIRRGTDERLAFLYLDRPARYPALHPLAGQEVAPASMIPALRDAVEQYCTVFWVFKQC